MFARLAAVSTLAFALLAAADKCSTGTMQCCSHLEKADSAAGAAILSVVGVVVQDLTAQIGVECSPINAVGVGGGSCSANAVCCENNNVGGLISVGCVLVEL